MKVGILAGGLGTRLMERTVDMPKPMVEIGGRPILWHIMKSYEAFGHSEFVLALGYKKEVITNFFLRYNVHAGRISVNLATGRVDCNALPEKWTVHMLDTGLNTLTAGRAKAIAQFAGKEPFMLTYGDGVSDVNINALLDFHRAHGKIATVTAVRPPARFGHIELRRDRVVAFGEKPQLAEGWINGGFFVFQPELVDFIEGDGAEMPLERGPLERLAAAGELMAYRHEGFWQCMDTLRDYQTLQVLWEKGEAPWANWLAPAITSLPRAVNA